MGRFGGGGEGGVQVCEARGGIVFARKTGGQW